MEPLGWGVGRGSGLRCCRRAGGPRPRARLRPLGCCRRAGGPGPRASVNLGWTASNSLPPPTRPGRSLRVASHPIPRPRGGQRGSSPSPGREATLTSPQAGRGPDDRSRRGRSRSQVTGAVGANDAGEPPEGAYDLAAPPRLKVLHEQQLQMAHGCALRASAASSHADQKSAGRALRRLARGKREHERALRCFLATGVVYVSEETGSPRLWRGGRRPD